MKTVTTKELIPKLAHQIHLSMAAGETPIYASDCDKTCWAEDIGDYFGAWALKKGVIRQELYPAFEPFLAESNPQEPIALTDADGVPRFAHDIYADVLGLHEEGKIDSSKVYELTAYLLTGYSETHAEMIYRACVSDALSERFGDFGMRPEMLQVFEFCREKHVAVYLISASPVGLIRAMRDALHLGNLVSGIKAMTPQMADGMIQPGLAKVVQAEGKIIAWHEIADRVGGTPALVGYSGDGGGDANIMLGRARLGILVTPGRSLLAKAGAAVQAGQRKPESLLVLSVEK